MLFPGSGRLGFDKYECSVKTSGKKIDRDTLKKIYERENQVRLSEEVQEEMDRCVLKNMDQYSNLIETIQRNVKIK